MYFLLPCPGQYHVDIGQLELKHESKLEKQYSGNVERFAQGYLADSQ